MKTRTKEHFPLTPRSPLPAPRSMPHLIPITITAPASLTNQPHQPRLASPAVYGTRQHGHGGPSPA
ncbi:uncharacterized protein K452DRAFT_283049 [Aplosporella prunicola CBS 121167]|uniref:Uncharacterized protein n=1 Tax=Aplosporella prunicola CBS 121167 TaxID=1176127 RepID=A0A6A6BUE4_9PEZI|nr:uncharacterized protein K452DRAFT_283049 [Aplosporella prunicola CBS 121167]KAF2146844.1 hypothetical protein K452DRAFT_283049 [Aplosporella prunicola CBS 121167]